MMNLDGHNFKPQFGISCQSLESGVTLMVMTGLETTATIIVGTALVPFLSAWDAKGPAGVAFRKAVRSLWSVAMLIVHLMGWIACGLIARAASLAHWKPGTIPGRHPRAYLYRRSYRGRHHYGTPLITLLATKEPCLAPAS